VTVQEDLHGPAKPGTQQDKGAKAMITTKAYPSMDQRIDAIGASASDREIAKEYMHEAELVADLLQRAGANLRFAGELLNQVFAQRAI
jgi:hypothetical protein